MKKVQIMMNNLKFEEEHVTLVYNQIAKSFSKTRSKEWPQVSKFINSFPINSFLGDIGCGNGRFILSRDDIQFEGCDASQGMVDICNERGLKVKYGNLTDLPFPDNYFDGLICIAVLHHLSTEERRKTAIKELTRILKPGGRMLIEVWSYEASFGTRFKFEQINEMEEQDKFLPWNSRDTEKMENRQRYYHLFKKEEIMELVQTETLELQECFLDHGNWFLILKKK